MNREQEVIVGLDVIGEEFVRFMNGFVRVELILDGFENWSIEYIVH